MKRLNILLVLVCLLFGFQGAKGQIALQYSDTTTCPGQTIQMCASLTGLATNINTDDQYSGVLDIGFNFEYFGKIYNKCVVSGNGLIRFDTTSANQFGANWMWSQAVASGQANNTIFVTFLDLHPATGNGIIRYQRFGQAPNRRFVVEWCSVPLFANSSACGAFRVTSQAILYEGSNLIDMFTTRLDPIVGQCPGASGASSPAGPANQYGQVIQGVRNELGTVAYFPTNRDPASSATNWGRTGATNDGMRFTPNGATTYLMDPVPFAPWVIIDSASSPDLKWYAEGEPNLAIQTGACATVTIDRDIHYYVVKFNGNAGCENNLVNFSDTVWIHLGTAYDTTRVEICAGESYNWFGKEFFKAGGYDTLLSTSLGCDSLLHLQLTVNPLPSAALKGGTNVQICAGSSTVLALASPSGQTSYQWYKDNYPMAGETGTQLTVTDAGLYKVVGTTNKGCTATSDIITLVVNPNPVATIEPLTGDVMCAFDTLELQAAPGAQYDYRWSPEKNFRMFAGFESQKVKGVFTEPTEVVLTVYNQFGCYDSDTVQVPTKPCCQVFVPNAFSPNGDGNNDYFKPELQLGQILLSMQVFDRYGKLVYNNTNIRRGWDGKYENGSEAGTDVYMYYIKYTCADGKLYEKKESVSLIR